MTIRMWSQFGVNFLVRIYRLLLSIVYHASMPPRRPKEEDDAVTDDEDYQPNDNRGDCDELQDDDEMLDSDVSAASQKLCVSILYGY